MVMDMEQCRRPAITSCRVTDLEVRVGVNSASVVSRKCRLPDPLYFVKVVVAHEVVNEAEVNTGCLRESEKGRTRDFWWARIPSRFVEPVVRQARILGPSKMRLLKWPTSKLLVGRCS